ncbi:Transcriptional regulator GerE family [Anoxybacillus flavithermus WK1]|uniref:Transcriptional regulator GerE family n=11 Tax=Bacillales TaxID=1385 RepID=B7GGV2_ANOFW|nr:Transcriptional regulator GerE family [Anoxybacillus flavithermus WK1]
MLTKYIPIRFGLVKARRVIHLNQKPLLTKREREVFELLLQDKTTKEIASELFISEKTVRNHISNAMQKLGVKGRSQAVVELLRMGELEL